MCYEVNSIPEVLASFADLSLNQEWKGQRNSHLAYEDALEEAGLKRKGERRDQKCYNYIVDRIIQFWNYGDVCLEKDFFTKYKSYKGAVNPKHPYSHLTDLANTIINWLEYTQLVKRDGGQVAILDDKREEVKSILAEKPNFIDRPEQHEYFQRKYGLDPKHRKDNCNLALTKTVTAAMIARQKIM